MADISITQAHTLTHKRAKAAAQKVADKLAEDYDMSSDWDGDVLLFERSGVSGSLTLFDKEAKLEIRLGFLLTAFAAAIEEKVAAKMAKAFTSKA